MTEKDLQIQVCSYIRYKYPAVRFSSNYGAGIKLTIHQASIQRKQQSHSGYPDLFVIYNNGKYNGLFIELKKDGVRLTKKDGSPASEHLARQDEYLEYLRSQGFYAVFCIGYNDTITTIDEYLGINTTKVEF